MSKTGIYEGKLKDDESENIQDPNEIRFCQNTFAEVYSYKKNCCIFLLEPILLFFLQVSENVLVLSH